MRDASFKGYSEHRWNSSIGAGVSMDGWDWKGFSNKRIPPLVLPLPTSINCFNNYLDKKKKKMVSIKLS